MTDFGPSPIWWEILGGNADTNNLVGAGMMVPRGLFGLWQDPRKLLNKRGLVTDWKVAWGPS